MIAGAILNAALVRPQPSQPESVFRFTDATVESGFIASHQLLAPVATLTQRAAGGLAAGDYDRDGDIDLYVVSGEIGANALFQNQGNGSFREVGQRAGAAVATGNSSGPLFFDFDGDGFLDLFVGATDRGAPVMLRNRRDGSFEDVTASAGLYDLTGAISATAGDYDRDGFQDLFISRWGTPGSPCHLFRNQRGRRFHCSDQEAGIAPFQRSLVDQTFTANFADLDQDGWLDLLVASDFGTSRLLRNRGAFYEVWSSTRLLDENGMGSAVGDYDGDLDLDWFVTSIRDADGVSEGDWGTSGNRLYRNDSRGTLQDVTELAGVSDGDWGWAACFADLDLDGSLDLVHVNGWPQGSAQFRGTPARLFLGGHDGRFVEQGQRLGFDERGGGRGLSCFDYDADGDIDLFVTNHRGPARLWRNDGGNTRGAYLQVKLEGRTPNSEGLGARVVVLAGGRTQLRELRGGSNYASQDPALAHFGLGAASRVDRVEVTWPDGVVTSVQDVAVNRRIVLSRREPAAVSDINAGGGCSFGRR